MSTIPEPSQFIDKLSNIKWLIQHAQDDETVSYDGSKKFVKLLKQHNTDLEYSFYETGGHLYESYMKDRIVNWYLKKFKF